MYRCNYISRIMTALLVMIVMTPHATAAPDYAREQRWASEIIPGLIIGEPIYLTQKNRHKFLGLYAEADNARMAVIVVHGMGLHPDWGMIGTLRQDLYDAGYTTLSVQMPILAADASYMEYPALFPEAAERLAVTVRYLQQLGYQRIAIVSHSNGSRMSRVYMAGNPKGIRAWVALSLTQGDTYAGINAPILDLYGENDLSHVLFSVSERKASFSNAASQQQLISGGNHFFAGKEETMVQAVKEYLDGVN